MSKSVILSEFVADAVHECCLRDTFDTSLLLITKRMDALSGFRARLAATYKHSMHRVSQLDPSHCDNNCIILRLDYTLYTYSKKSTLTNQF